MSNIFVNSVILRKLAYAIKFEFRLQFIFDVFRETFLQLRPLQTLELGTVLGVNVIAHSLKVLRWILDCKHAANEIEPSIVNLLVEVLTCDISDASHGNDSVVKHLQHLSSMPHSLEGRQHQNLTGTNIQCKNNQMIFLTRI